MKYYAIFHAYSGDRSVLRLDGRKSPANMHYDARVWAERHSFTKGTYTIERGDNLQQTFAVSTPRSLEEQ